ncbi:MAG: DUF4416 family protein [Planctomycetota bacterium]
MGAPRPPEAALLFAAVFGADAAVRGAAMEQARARWGAPVLSLAPFPFTQTDYYAGEMGSGLFKEFHLFGAPFDPAGLPAVKLATNAIEGALAAAGRRRVNIDPGYLTLSKVILATTKDYSHRLYLHDGIFAEVTLAWHKGMYYPQPWTYPDYRIEAVTGFFGRCRAHLRTRPSGGDGPAV